MKRCRVVCQCAAWIVVTYCAIASAGDFNQFRGPASGVVQDESIPLTWSNSENLAWKVALPGVGWSQPVVWQNRLYLTMATSDPPLRPKNFADGVKTPQSMGLGGLSGPPNVNIDWQVICLDGTSGQVLWTRTVVSGKPKYPVHPSNTYATESPAVNADGLFAFFGATGALTALSHDGQTLWQQDLGAYPSSSGFGTGSSLAIDGSNVIAQHFTSKSGLVVCADTKSGSVKWKFERAKLGSSWSSPIVWRNKQRREVIVAGNEEVNSLNPDSGELLWKIEKVKAPTACSAASDSERLYFGGSDPFSKGPLFALSAGNDGDLSPEKSNGNFKGCAWSIAKAGPGMSSPVSNGQFLFVVDGSILRCYDAASGERIYQDRLPGIKQVAASPLIVGENLFVLDEAGSGVLVKVGRNFEVVGGGQLDDIFWSTPAIANDAIYMRGIQSLYCIRQPQ